MLKSIIDDSLKEDYKYRKSGRKRGLTLKGEKPESERKQEET